MSASGLVDYHIHTKYCKHAEGEMDEYVSRALSLGLAEIGFAAHMPVMPQPELCLSYEDLSVYLKEAESLRDKFKGKIPVKIGGEIDVMHEKYPEIQSILESYDYDYIIGSLHYLDSWPFDQKEYIDGFDEEPLELLYDNFFGKIISIASSGLCDIMGHIDNLKRMGFPLPNNPVHYYRKVIEVVGDHGLTVELNTAGLDAPVDEIYPAPVFLEMFIKAGIPITLGSDAHKPEDMGRHFDYARTLLKEFGLRKLRVFEQRKGSYINLC